MVSLRVVGGTAYVLASVVFLYWRVQVAFNDTKLCPRASFAACFLGDTKPHTTDLDVRIGEAEVQSKPLSLTELPTAQSSPGSSPEPSLEATSSAPVSLGSSKASCTDCHTADILQVPASSPEFANDKPSHSTRPFPEEKLPKAQKQAGGRAKPPLWGTFGSYWLLKVLEQAAESIDTALKEDSDPAGIGSLGYPEVSRGSSSPSAVDAPGLSTFQDSLEDSSTGASTFLSSPLTVLSLLNIMAIFAVLLKETCLGTLSFMEAHRLVEMALGYVFVKLIFFVIVFDSIDVEGAEWLILWVCFFGVLKVLERLAKERFQRLTASPSATVVHHARTLGLMAAVLTVDVLMCALALPHFPALDIPKGLLLCYEPAAVALETTQTMVRYGFHLAEEFPQILSAAGKLAPFTPFLNPGISGAEWRASVLHHSNAAFEVSCTLLTLGHCLHLWQLHSFSFHIIDIVLFLNARSLMGKLVKRARSFLRWRATLRNLQSALPDASADDISSFADDCAICKEPMTAAKRLPCGHLFHLSCLRSWLDQGSAASHSCPSCRRSLRPTTEPQGPSAAAGNAQPGRAQTGEAQAAGPLTWMLDQLVQWAQAGQARQEQAQVAPWAAGAQGVGRPQGPGAGDGVQAHGQAGVGGLRPAGGGAPRAPDVADAGADALRQRGFGLSFSGLRFRGSRGADGERERGGGGVRVMGRLWSDVGRQSSRRVGTEAAAESPEELESRLVAMAAQVEEILPHVPFTTILQDLRRTRSVMVTVNNLMDVW